MTIRDKIIKDIKESFFPNFSDIAEKNKTSRSYVLEIYNEIPREIKSKEKEIDTPKFWNPENELSHIKNTPLELTKEIFNE